MWEKSSRSLRPSGPSRCASSEALSRRVQNRDRRIARESRSHLFFFNGRSMTSTRLIIFPAWHSGVGYLRRLSTGRTNTRPLSRSKRDIRLSDKAGVSRRRFCFCVDRRCPEEMHPSRDDLGALAVRAVLLPFTRAQPPLNEYLSALLEILASG